MKRYILKRLVISIITIWLIATCSFFLLHALPGTPFGTTQLMSQEMRDKMMAYYGLDRPPLEQYLTFLSNLIRGDFGYSLKYVGQSVNGIIAQTFPVSAQLGLQAYLLSFPIGIFFGIIAARRRGRPLDYALVGFSVQKYSAPTQPCSSSSITTQTCSPSSATHQTWRARMGPSPRSCLT